MAFAYNTYPHSNNCHNKLPYHSDPSELGVLLQPSWGMEHSWASYCQAPLSALNSDLVDACDFLVMNDFDGCLTGDDFAPCYQRELSTNSDSFPRSTSDTLSLSQDSTLLGVAASGGRCESFSAYMEQHNDVSGYACPYGGDCRPSYGEATFGTTRQRTGHPSALLSSPSQSSGDTWYDAPTAAASGTSSEQGSEQPAAPQPAPVFNRPSSAAPFSGVLTPFNTVKRYLLDGQMTLEQVNQKIADLERTRST